MKSANSARLLCILGATLVAASFSQIAIADVSVSSAQGIHTGSSQGIHTGSVEGIHTGSVEGIHTGSALGIHTGSILGIHTGSVEGIHTGSVEGIHTGSVQGIHTGSIQGIHTGSVEGIHTGSVEGIHTGSTQGIHTGSITHLVLAAPVSSVDLDTGTFSALGQTVSASGDVLSELAAGDYVSVYGSVSGPGYLYADAVMISAERYIPGSSSILVTGFATEIDRALGRARLGGLDVDYTAALSSGMHPETGFVTFQGTQPLQDVASLVGTSFRNGFIE